MTAERLLSICYPKQMHNYYSEYSDEKMGTKNVKYGDIPKDTSSGVNIEYTSPAGKNQSAANVHYCRRGKFTRLEEKVMNSNGGVSFTRSQMTGSEGALSIKENKVTSRGKEYSSEHFIDHTTGHDRVIRKKGNVVIGGYEINKPVKQTFAQGFKARLQKLGMAVATDSNGCERPVLKNVGEMFLKLAKRIK